ncbi:hypothetical protein [Streptomyces macrosporus]|uniref:C2H2-type domain-containing protein n=1 Tax=Streptomyces macrosporus TaxID=44032 RepID=A0ABP5WCW9_9ACTN
MSDGAHGIHTAHEAYAFVCLRCGHGWERSYDIEHHVDGRGRETVAYVLDGAYVPSPLTRPGCAHCGSRVVRILRAGRVSSARGPSRRPSAPSKKPEPRAGDAREKTPVRAESPGGGRWKRRLHIPALLRLVHRKRAGQAY